MSSRDKDGGLSVPKFSSFKPRELVDRTDSDGTRSNGDEKKPGVPKFSSFKPKEPVPRDEPHESRSRESRGSHHRRREDDSTKTSRSHREHHRRDEEPPRKRGRHDRGEDAPRPRTRPDKDGVPGLFVIDGKGDPLIRRYGEFDRMHSTWYKRHGAGRVLGTPGRLIIHHDGPRDQFSLRMPGEGPLSRDHGGLRSKQFRPSVKPIQLRGQRASPSEDVDGGYLAIDESRNGGRGEETESSDDEELSYRSIEGQSKTKAINEHENDEEDASDFPRDEVSMEQSNPLQWKTIQLNRVVKEHPENTDAWLELVRHQDALLQANHPGNGIIPANEAHSCAEIKLSMLESALSHATMAESKRSVLIQLMKEGSKVWPAKTAAKKWAGVEADEKDSFELWKTHLDAATSSIATFKYEEVRGMLLERLNLVLTRGRLDPSGEVFKEAIYVFLRMTCLLHDAGYMELAVAAWQGLLDLNLFRPTKMESDEWALQTFGEFWENELPRFGEAGFQGWAKYAANGDGEAPEPVRHGIAADDASSSSSSSSSRDAYKAWGRVERRRGQEAKMPARTLDEGVDDDPFRVVIFSDIEGMLFLIPESVLPTVNEQLVDAFLLFSGYPPAFRSSRWTDMAHRDQFIWRSGEEMTLKTPPEYSDDVDSVDTRKSPFEGAGLGFLATPPDLYFANKTWSTAQQGVDSDRRLSLQTVSNATRDMVLGAGLEKLGYYHLTVNFCVNPENLKKSAKALLKRYPTNAELYNAYALMEAASGHGDVADKVLSSALELTMSSGEVGAAMLRTTWSLMEFDAGRLDRGLTRLCAAVHDSLRRAQDGPAVTPTQIYEAYRVFSAKMDDALDRGDISSAGVFARALTLLTYLRRDGGSEPKSALQGDISTAMAAIHAATQKFRAHKVGGSVAHERILQFGAKLLYLHACKGPFRRGYMREQLTLFLGEFPSNCIFLLLYEWSDSSVRVIDETRQMLAEKVLVPDHDNVTSRFLAIKHELGRGNLHSAKAAYERAVASDVSKSNPELWASYVRFCRAHGELRRGARDVFYRGLRHCPWSKQVVMEAFGAVVGLLSSEELKSVYGTMTSKGLRVHEDMDDYLDKKRGQGRDDGRRR